MTSSLSSRLRDQKLETRMTAVNEAAMLESSAINSELVKALLDVLTDADPKLVVASLETVGQWAQRGVLPEDVDIRYAVRRSANHDHARVRSEAAVTLVLMDEPATESTVNMLLKLLEDEHPRVRQEAAAALGDAGDTRAVNALNNCLNDEDEQTRFEASFALASLGDARGIPILLAETNSSKRRLDALEGIRRLKDPSALETLQALSKRFFLGWPERLTVYATMYSLGDTDAVAYLIEKTQSRNKAERSLAFGMIGTHQVIEALELLDETARDQTSKLRINAIHSLGEMRNNRARKILEEIAVDTSNDPQILAEVKDAIARH